MKDGHFQILLLEEINKIFGLPVDNDFSNYIEKYDNGVFRTDRNFEYTAYINNSIKTFIVSFKSELWHKYISQKSKISCVRLKLYKIDLEYIGKLKLDYVKLHFNNSEIACFKIVTTNVYMNFLDDEEAEFFEADRSQIEPPDFDPSANIPYLGLRNDEHDTGHWNID